MTFDGVPRPHPDQPATAVSRLLRERDEAVVELQHLVRELRHEMETLMVELALARHPHLWSAGGEVALGADSGHS